MTSHFRVFVSNPEPIILLAEKLQGTLVRQENRDHGIVLSFEFALPTFGEQFLKAAVLYPEVLL
jgi:hypothetical protein